MMKRQHDNGITPDLISIMVTVNDEPLIFQDFDASILLVGSCIMHPSSPSPIQHLDTGALQSHTFEN